MEIMFYQLSEDELMEKLNVSYTNVTCFFTEEIAEQVMEETIEHNKYKILTWLLKGEPYANKYLKIYCTHREPIGYGIGWENQKKVTNLVKSYVILQKSYYEEFQEGYFIKFSAPLLEKGAEQ